MQKQSKFVLLSVFGFAFCLLALLIVIWERSTPNWKTWSELPQDSPFEQKDSSSTKVYRYSGSPLVVHIEEGKQILVYFRPGLPVNHDDLVSILKAAPQVTYATVGGPRLQNLNLRGLQPGVANLVFPTTYQGKKEVRITVFVLPDLSENGYLARERRENFRRLRRYFWPFF